MIEPLRILSTTIGEIGTVGMACLIALHIADRNVSEPDLMIAVHVDSISTLRRHLSSCAAHDYASMIKPGRLAAAMWHITDIGKSIIMRVISLLGLPRGTSTGTIAATPAHPALITAPELDVTAEKNFFSGASSSSSDLIDQSGSDQTDQIEEEEEDGRDFKIFLCREYGFTGDRAAQMIADPRIWSDDICAWMYRVAQMRKNGFKFRKSAEAYALSCLLKPEGPDEPDAEAREASRWQLDQYWQRFCAARDAEQQRPAVP
jgi:hypothetical protein